MNMIYEEVQKRRLTWTYRDKCVFHCIRDQSCAIMI